MEKIFVVKRVAETLWAAEDAMDEAVQHASALTGDIVQARKDLQTSHLLWDASLAKVAEAQAALAAARTAMMQAHDALYEVKLRLGIRQKLDGPHWSVQEDHRAPETSEYVRRAG
jgi:hypothetical protein